METWTRWIVGLLLISLTGAHGLLDFPENFVVAKRNDANPVTLTCGAGTEGNVTWKLDGSRIEDAGLGHYIKQHGQNLNVSEVNTPMLGEYSCWRGDSHLRCRAKSYDCQFSCVWNRNEYTAVRLGLGHNCSEGEKSCNWVNKTKQHPEGGFHFRLTHDLSPYVEESTMMELTVEALNDLSIFTRTKRFYLRDIVQPDSPQIVRCQEVGQDLNVTIDPPSSWSTPHSFFTLEHEIEYRLKDDDTTGRSSSPLVPKRISKLRVRSRDPLVPSPWSQWTDWKNVA